MFALLVATPAFAAPANDDFANATVISKLPSHSHENTIGATVEGGEPTSTCNTMGETVWFEFTPGSNMDLDANTFGSRADGGSYRGEYDTVIAVYTYDGSFTQVTCDDDAATYPDSKDHVSDVSFAATGGTTYYFQVGTYDVDVGTYTVAKLAFTLKSA